MKIINLKVEKETGDALRCIVTLEDGSQIESVVPWRNPLGLWASSSEARDHLEICAWLRSFARVIEVAGTERDAA